VTALAETRNLLTAVPAPLDEDAALARRAAAGDMRAFEQLYRRHVGRVHGAIWRLAGGNSARAEELTQEAFVRAWQKLDSFRYESAFGTWLYRLAVNVALMAARSRAGGEDKEEELGQDDRLPGADAGGGRQRELGIDLERAVATLPPRARAVLVLHDIEGWRHDEIATELGVAVGSSKAHLHRARQLLRRALGESE
jgi:RNA polymerase sigma-70 factor (ECF subfamily)